MRCVCADFQIDGYGGSADKHWDASLCISYAVEARGLSERLTTHLKEVRINVAGILLHR